MVHCEQQYTRYTHMMIYVLATFSSQTALQYYVDLLSATFQCISFYPYTSKIASSIENHMLFKICLFSSIIRYYIQYLINNKYQYTLHSFSVLLLCVEGRHSSTFSINSKILWPQADFTSFSPLIYGININRYLKSTHDPSANGEYGYHGEPSYKK